MRRSLTRIGVAVAVFAVAAWVGFAAAAKLAPSHLRARIERGLADSLGVPVSLARVELRLAQGLLIEAQDGVAGPFPDGSTLRSPSARARVDLLSLLLGRLELRRLLLADTSLALGGPEPRDPADSAGWLGAVEKFAGILRALDLPVRVLDVEHGRIHWVDRQGVGLALADLNGSLRIGRLTGRGEVGFEADLEGPDASSRGHLRVEGTRRSGALDIEMAISGFELSALERAVAPLPIARLRGDVGGVLRWRAEPGAPHQLSVALAGRAWRGRLNVAGAPDGVKLALDRPDLRAEIELAADALRVRSAELTTSDAKTRAHGRLGLPMRNASPLEFDLQLREVSLADLGHWIAELPGPVRNALPPFASRIEAGQVTRLAARGRTSIAGVGEMAAQQVLARPGELTVELEVTDASLGVGQNDRLEGLSGSAVWTGDAIELRNVRSRLAGDPLPRLDARLQGLSNVRHTQELNCVRPPHVPTLPGLRRLQEWVDSRREEPDEPQWEELAIRADWLVHPVLLCSVEHLVANLEPARRGLDFAVRQAIWAGLPLHGQGTYRKDDDGRSAVKLELDVGPPYEAMNPAPPKDPWASGRFEWIASGLGQWRIHGASGGFRLSGTELRLSDSELWLRPGGAIEGNLSLEIGAEQMASFRLDAQGKELDLTQLTRSAGLTEHRITGRLSGAASVAGELVNGEPPLAAAEGLLSLQARDGRLHRLLPPLLALTVASDRLNPFGSRDQLPYSAIDLVADVSHGRLETRELAFYAPTVRMGASIDLGISDPHELEGVIGIFFFPRLDSWIDRVPLINRAILGPNGNLVGAYFSMTGHWDDPEASLVPIKSFASGPASFVLEGLPNFVWGGIQRIRSVLAPDRNERESPESRPRADS